MLIEIMLFFIAIVLYAFLANYLSYFVLKKRILEEREWGLNICCGRTDGGGLNVDIIQHEDVPRFKLVSDIYNLPFVDGQFETVLCSHTIEHVDDPEKFYKELQRVGQEVTLVVPPLYDLAAVLNIFEHKWIFLTFRKRHHTVPYYIRLPFADLFHSRFGQTKTA